VTASVSLGAYRQLSQQRRAELLHLRSGHQEPLGSDHPTPVATTWDLSFARLRERAPTAAELLHWCAWLALSPFPNAS
jgi:hypothetical protein